MRTPLILLLVLIPAACAGPRTFVRSTPVPLADAFTCAQQQLLEMEYELSLADSVGRVLQGHREITGIREVARRGAGAATEVITGGLAGGKSTRYDELTVFVYFRPYPRGNTIEATAGMLTVTEDGPPEQGRPTDAARGDARTLVESCQGG